MSTQTKLPPCPPIKLLSKPGPRQNQRPSDGTAYAALYSGPMERRLAELAANVGTKSARRQWYQLRRRILRINRILQRQNMHLVWTNPPHQHPAMLTLTVAVVDDRQSKIYGKGVLTALNNCRADVAVRQLEWSWKNGYVYNFV